MNHAHQQNCPHGVRWLRCREEECLLTVWDDNLDLFYPQEPEMSYKSAGPDVYDPTIRTLLDAKVPDETIAEVSDRLITNLQNDDWDTERNSLELFAEYPVIVRSFERHGVHLPSSQYMPLGKEEFDALNGYHFRDEDWEDAKPYVPDLPLYILANASSYADEIKRLRRLCEENGVHWD